MGLALGFARNNKPDTIANRDWKLLNASSFSFSLERIGGKLLSQIVIKFLNSNRLGVRKRLFSTI